MIIRIEPAAPGTFLAKHPLSPQLFCRTRVQFRDHPHPVRPLTIFAILFPTTCLPLLRAAELPPLPEVGDYAGGEMPGKNVSGVTMDLRQTLEQAVKVSPDLKTAKLEVERMMRRLFGVKLKYYPEFDIVVEAPRVFDYMVDQVNPAPSTQRTTTTTKTGATGVTTTTTQTSTTAASSQEFTYRTTEPGVGVAYAQHLPTNTDLTAKYGHDVSSRGILSDRLSLQFSQELVRKDPIWLQKTLVEKQVWLEKQAQASVDREFCYQVKSAYYTVVEARLTFENALTRFEQDKQFAEESERKYQAGIIAEYAVLDYRRDFEQSRNRMVQRRSLHERARNELLYLLQMPFDSRVTFQEVPEPGIDPELCDMRRMIDSGIRSALQIAQLRYNLFSNEENLKYLRNSLLPSVRLQAGASWWQTIGDAELNPAAELQGRDLSAGLLVSMPLFGDQFNKGNNILIERLDRTINETEIQDQFRETVKDVRNSLVTVDELRERYEIARRILETSTRDFELSRLRFEVGNIGSWDMIRSKNEYFSALDDLVTLRYSLLRRLAEIERDYPFLYEKEQPKKGGAS